MFYGSLTGTITTGIALVRMVDPELRTPATADYCYASGLTFFLAIPLIMIMNLPAATADSGTTAGYWVTAAVLLTYGLVLLLVFRFLASSRNFAKSDIAFLNNKRKTDTSL
jgi:ESS family glutamate:Na+ symporter